MAFIKRQVVKGPEGKPHIQWIDTQTREPIPFDEIGDHTIIEHGIGLDFLDRPETEEEEEEEEALGGGESTSSVLDDYWLKGDNAPSSLEEIKPVPRTEENNFGFIKKPVWMKLINKVPGAVGFAAKAASAMINTNNVTAVSSAREFLGLPKLTTKEIAKGLIVGTKGKIGEVVIDGKPTVISLDTDKVENSVSPSTARAFIDAELGLVDAIEPNSDLDNLPDLENEQETSQAPTETQTESTPVQEGQEENRAVAGREITPGAGLANLAPRGLAGLQESYGPKRPNAPTDKNLLPALQRAVANAFGPDYTVVATSGKGEHGSNRHRIGLAVDFHVNDPQGNRVTDQGMLNKLAAEMGRQGIQSAGHGAGYMGQGKIHADLHNRYGKNQGPTWGGDSQFAKAFLSERTPVGVLPSQVAQTPSANPGSPSEGTSAEAFVNNSVQKTPGAENTVQIDAPALSSTPAPQAANGPTPVPMPAPQVTSSDTLSMNEGLGFVGGRGLGGNVRSALQGKGLTPQQMNMMSFAIAGELGSKTLANLASGNPRVIEQIRKEIADISATMVNRARSTRFADRNDPISSVLTGSQYNSLLPGNLNTTNQNYSVAKDFIQQAVSDFNDGKLTGNAPNATHYYNADLVTPSWASATRDPAIASGEHTFVNPTIAGRDVLEYQQALPKTAPVPTGRPTVAQQAIQSFVSNPVDTRTAGSFSKDFTPTYFERAIPTTTPSTALTSEEARALSQANISLVSPEEYAAMMSTTSPERSIGGFSYVSPIEGIATYSVSTSSLGRNAGQILSSVADNQDGYYDRGIFGYSTGSGYGSQRSAGLGNMTNLGSYTPAGGIANTDLGYGFSAGSLGGSASGFGSGYGSAGSSASGGFTGGNFGGADYSGGYSSAGDNAPSGYSGGPGSGGGFSGSYSGSTDGWSGGQSSAGVSSPGGTYSGGSAGVSGAESSFGGFSAGSLGGSASGFGSGYGSAGSSASVGGGFSGSAGNNYSGGRGGNDSYSDYSSYAGPNSYDSGSGGSGGSGDGTVLCTHYYMKGRIPKKIFIGDLRYSTTMVHPRTRSGYLFWAEPFVRWLEKKNQRPLVDFFLFPIVHGWAIEMARKAGYTERSSLVGKIFSTPLAGISYVIGYIKEKI